MKTKFIFIVVLTLAFFIGGCASGTPVPYSFAETGEQTASITFITNKKREGVDLYYFGETELPMPESKQYWAPVSFPAGRPFDLTVAVYYNHIQRGEEKTFNCPALTAGSSYELRLHISEPRRVLGFTVRGRIEKLVLRDITGGKKVVYEQQILP